MTSFEYWSLVWATVSAVCLASTGAIILVTAFLAFGQIKEAVRARSLQSAIAIVDHISSPGLRAARRLIYDHHDAIAKKVDDNPDWDELDEFFLSISGGTVDFKAFHTYLASLENVAMLVMHDLVPDDLVQMYLGRMGPVHWLHLGPLIRYMRRRYSSDDFLQHFEMLVKLIQRDGLRLQGALRPSLPLRIWNQLYDPSRRKKRALLLERLKHRRKIDEDFVASLGYYHTEGH